MCYFDNHRLDQLPRLIKVFDCWQDHLPPETHRRLIRAALQEAISRLERDFPADFDIRVEMDHDTRGDAGAESIADRICKKLRKSTIVVGDVTPRSFDADGSHTAYPNSNVMLELGYAASAIGWNRIILIQNVASGIHPSDLPFDIRHRRVMKYNCKSEDHVAPQRPKMVDDLHKAMRLVIQSILAGVVDPLLPMVDDLRMRDIRQLTKLLETFHRPAITYILRLSKRYRVSIIEPSLYEAFKDVFTCMTFQLNDIALKERCEELFNKWSGHIQASSLVFTYEGKREMSHHSEPWSASRDVRFKAWLREIEAFEDEIPRFLEFVHLYYPEIDMHETDLRSKPLYDELLLRYPQ